MFTLSGAAEQIRTGKLSPVELTKECLRRIDRLNPALNAFITVVGEHAMDEARRAEQEISVGNYRGPLHGVPLALKDNIDTAGVRTTAASNQYRDRVPQQDADIVRQAKLAGSIIVGKTNMHEFAFGGSGVVSAFGSARNPWDTSRITGGSSSGTAAALAAGMCVAALGTDTAGSVRCPAALCGITGYRPSQGLLSNAGTIPLAESYDTPGPITRTAEDAEIILRALAPIGNPCSPETTKLVPVAKLRAGVAQNLASTADPQVAACFEQAVVSIAGIVASVSDVEVIARAEWDVRNFEIYSYHEQMFKNSPELYDPRTLDRVRGSAGTTEFDYVRKRELAKQDSQLSSVFDSVDVVLSPTVPVTAPLLADLETMESVPLRQYEVKFLLANTAPFSFLWWPSISVPCGFTMAGLPAGLQISARPGADWIVLALAIAYERTTQWYQKTPATYGAAFEQSVPGSLH